MRRIAIVVTTLFLTLTTTVTTVHNPPQQKAQITTVRAVKHCRVTRITTHSKPTVHHRKKHRKPAVKRYATFVVTAYTANDSGMSGRGITASGTVATPWKTVAASRQWPYGTLLRTPDGRLLTVEDRGGAITGNKLDLYVGSIKRVAYQFGRRIERLQIVRIGRR